MELFELIPQRLFSVLTSPYKDIYTAALFIVWKKFRLELVIRKEELASSLADELENRLSAADFEEDRLDEGSGDGIANEIDLTSLRGKSYFILRRLLRDGWIEEEQDRDSFDINVTVPDYAVKIIRLLYELTEEETKEYNSYVYATYAALKNVEDNEGFYFNALTAAFRNSENLVDELKSLFNNIKRYQKKAEGTLDVNRLLEQLLVNYRRQIIDQVYYPLKTIDSVPRFKNPILAILAEWEENEEIQKKICIQGLRSKVYSNEETARVDIIRKINYIADVYGTVEELIDSIDRKHNDYTNASIDRIRYMMNSDRSIKGKLVEILKQSDKRSTVERMKDAVYVFSHSYYDERSLYERKSSREPFSGNAVHPVDTEGQSEMVDSFLRTIRSQYTSKKIDAFILGAFGGKTEFASNDLPLHNSEEFILMLLGSIRGNERTAPYRVKFKNEYIENEGYRIPLMLFEKKGKENV